MTGLVRRATLITAARIEEVRMVVLIFICRERRRSSRFQLHIHCSLLRNFCDAAIFSVPSVKYRSAFARSFF